MTFKCAICGEEVCCTKEDESRFKAQGFECDLCYSVIVKKRYKPTNKKGGVTIFSPVNSALGDAVIEKPVRDKYKIDNPDETVIDISVCDSDEAVRVYRPNKFFWASTTQFMERPKFFKVINYSVPVEATWLAKSGVYPTFAHNDQDVIDVGTDRFAVLNFRNIFKCGWKNAEPFLVNVVLMHLNKYIDRGLIDCAVVVGNDDRDGEIYWPEWIIDKRKKLELRQIASLCSRSEIYIGKDCGVAHLAAAAGAKNMIVWGYTEKQWILKTHPDRFVALMKQDSTASRIKSEIDRRFEHVAENYAKAVCANQ